MGAWAKDPVPDAAAGASLVARRAVSDARGDVGSSSGASPRGEAQGLAPMRPWALRFRILYHILEYYILILYI